MMRKSVTIPMAIGAIVVLAAAAMAGHASWRGEASARAAVAAMHAVGGIGAVPQSSDVGTWSFKVTKADGSIADVVLDERLEVLAVDGRPAIVPASTNAATDREGAADDGEPNGRDDDGQGSSSDDREEPVPSSDADRAAEAALRATGGGRVHDVDRDAEGGATWEVEITTREGKEVDVLLDANFRVLSVGDERESNETDDRDDGDEGRDDD